MKEKNMSEKYSVQNMVEALNSTFTAFLEMQYHIKDESLIRERHQMLTQGKNIISRLPFIEATPVYKQLKSFKNVDLNPIVKKTLIKLSTLNVGIYPKPYEHQVEALKAFFNDNKDLVISTGTGSGKTESFLMPILGKLAIEASERPNTAKLSGCRALLLYPLNALVNDQLGRLRKLFGNPEVAKIISGNCGRFFRFGAYNSRTPYPGQRSSAKDSQHMKTLFEDYYLNPIFLNRKEKLENMGKWPSKDLKAFYAKDLEAKKQYQSGKKAGELYTQYNWNDRLKTQSGDRELLMRHEMHTFCPDILITNYSMLEYMLMRPIERSIFQQTKSWLFSDPRNELILVIDEAHTYRGTGGAEVALLIRRLQSRLGVSRERIRFILTSASLGNEPDIITFANDLTGFPQESKSSIFHVIIGEKEKYMPGRNATINEAKALASFDINKFLNYTIDPKGAINSIEILSKQLGWSQNNMDSLHHYLFDQMNSFPPAKALIEKISKFPLEFKKLSESIFPKASASVQVKATSTLLSLCTFARRESDGRIFLPARLHLFYRGLPGLYACINPKCHCRLDQKGDSFILGRLYGISKNNCDCGGRVFELLTHQDCGSAFIRGYIHGSSGDFLLHEPSKNVGREITQELIEVHLLVEHLNQPSEADASKLFIDINTGKLIRGKLPEDPMSYLQAFIPNKAHPERIQGKMKISFDRCPICNRGLTQSPYKMMSFTTKGEGAFANLVKAQIIHQPPQKIEHKFAPNAGRKTLLFSDGRQKAARLALFIPREVELDSFRQVICLAWQKLQQLNREARLTKDLYIAFIAVVSDFHLQFFDQRDQQDLRQHIQHFEEDYDSDLQDVLEYGWEVTPPPKYYEALLRQLCHPFYSFQATTIGYVSPSKRAEKRLIKDFESIVNIPKQECLNITLSWINELLKEYAFNKSIPGIHRNRAANFSRLWGHSGIFRSSMKKILLNDLQINETSIIELQNILCKNLCNEADERYFLDPSNIRLTIDLERNWYHCQNCAYISPVIVAKQCPQCKSTNVNECHPSDSYIKARKRFFREPVLAALSGGHPRHITAEEHTAQLSQKDSGNLYATTEKHELRFQDILLDDREGPIDVLSCTTTMEVGVDIGSLIAVGLRNVPPQRENYQQRAGRTGRRGTAVSTVITYAQGGHHDSYYFHHPEKIIAGQVRKPVIDITNEKIVKRHVYAFLFQTFFHETIDKGKARVSKTSDLFSALGSTIDFFNENDHEPFNLKAFEKWIYFSQSFPENDLFHEILKWLPNIRLPAHIPNKRKWLEDIVQDLIKRLKLIFINKQESEGLLAFLFDQNFLPTYSFPRDLVSFMVQKKKNNKIEIKEQPQRNISLALSEFAPGRLVVINKTIYRSGGITSLKSTVKDTDQAEKLFASKQLKKYVHCTACSYVQDTFTVYNTIVKNIENCPICNGIIAESDMLIPEKFHPEKAKAIEEFDNDQEITYAGSAQFPVPVGEVDLGNWRPIGKKGQLIHALDRRLVIVNTGKGFDMDGGFEICVKCGATVPINSHLSLPKRHKRPYLLSKYEELCTGETRKVILGTTFLSDLLLIRIPIRKPFSTNMISSINRNALEDALRSLSETLLLAASRVLDVDPVEFKVGFRIVPNPKSKAVDGDIYLFDSLSGGAGYSDQAGFQIDEILDTALEILRECPSKCEHSCQDCLRHYGNQFWHDNLDRFLALSLLNYVMTGNLPKAEGFAEQRKQLSGLKRLLVLDGYQCIETDDCPLSLQYLGKMIDLSICPALMESKFNKNSSTINHYFLQRNLPGVYQMVKDLLK
ncbi:DEAD/DEAH box helicase [Candidatus Magnetomorum sp. HK-1]|nr:DEAD/DEAH box helicase [Candidatus Magnetomorum sp. HK-1]